MPIKIAPIIVELKFLSPLFAAYWLSYFEVRCRLIVFVSIAISVLIIAEFFAYLLLQVQADVKGERSLPGKMRSTVISIYAGSTSSIFNSAAPGRGFLYMGYLGLLKGVAFLLCFVAIHVIVRLRRVPGNKEIWSALHKTFEALGFLEFGFGPVFLAVYAVIAATNNFVFASSGAFMVYILTFIIAVCVIYLPLMKFQSWLVKKGFGAVSKGNELEVAGGEEQVRESA